VIRRKLAHAAEPLRLVRVIGVAEQQGNLDPLAKKLAQAAHPDLAVCEDDGRGHLRDILRTMLRHPPLQNGRAIVFLQYRLDDVARPLAHLGINTSHVLAEQADAE